MIKFSSSFKLNEIHRVDSPFDEDPKNIIFFQGGPNLGGRTAEKWAIQGHLLLRKLGGGESRKSISVPTPWYQNLCNSSIFLHARPSFRKIKKSQNLTLF